MKESGVDWIGKIPQDWSVIKFKKLILSSNGGEVIDKGYWNVGNELLYTCQVTPMKSNYENFPERKRTKKGDLLLTRNATPYIFLPEEGSIYSNVVQRVKLREHCYPNYVKYATLLGAQSLVVNGDTIPSYNMQVWKNIFIPNIPYDAQKKIADFLDVHCRDIDEVINKTEQSIEDYSKLKQTVITKAVTRGIKPEDRRMKESGVKWIGMIPEDWSLVRIKTIFNNRKEKNDPIKTEEILSLGINYGVIPYSEKKASGNKAKEDLSAYLIAHPGDIVVNSMNIVAGAVGLSRYYGCVSPVYYMLYLKNPEEHEANYYYDIFQTKVFQRSLLGLGNGILIKESSNGTLNTVRMRIPYEKLGIQLLPCPSKQEQEEIAKYIAEKSRVIDELIDEKKRFVSDLKKYKQAIIFEYITGKKEVPGL